MTDPNREQRIAEANARAHNASVAFPPRDEVNRYDRLSPDARALLEGFDELDLAEMLVATQAGLDGAYRERAHLVALLATLYPSVIVPALDLDEPGWWIAYLTIGGRQASWHISPRDAGLFTRVERVHRDDPRALWDGHTTDAKYEWLREHTAQRAAVTEPKEG